MRLLASLRIGAIYAAGKGGSQQAYLGRLWMRTVSNGLLYRGLHPQIATEKLAGSLLWQTPRSAITLNDEGSEIPFLQIGDTF